MRVWGKTWNRAVILRAGGSGFPPVRFRIGLPWCLFTRRAEMQCSRPRPLAL